MPLPTDKNLITLSEDLITGFQTLFGKHPGFRPNHARGVLLTGTFVPSSFAATLSSAPHFNQSSIPVTVRFSSATGLPLVSDTDPAANPRSTSIRFHLGDRVHTDIISHSVNSFLARTGEEFLEFLRASAESPPGGPSPSPREKWLAAHPAALRFVKTPKPSPSSFARENYFGVHAYKFTNKDGKEQFARYRVTPDAGADHLDDATTEAKDPDFLFNEINTRIHQGPVSFQLWAQIAEDGDTLDDVTVSWPETRQVLDLGKITLNAFVEDDPKEQKYIIFDPIPRVEGIEPSADPLLELRASVNLLSGRQRRAA
ncbi:hypothetical protein BS47DRAFT_1355989 [Hydnum rufescens UP504]|uniref:Catalase core domain-containing protein n=1 Tax=Hydnum rufescens UP504 TaxID=1448309 RepID=A0A9P6DM32_9AGAM|nr:hypothetical protein BS47DRAFT_1355989 [Hydnum rufescens UP504]